MTRYARVTETGEIVVPAELARLIGVAPGDVVTMDAEGQDIVLKTYADIVREGQQAYRATIKRRFTVDQFLSERRAEAASD